MKPSKFITKEKPMKVVKVFMIAAAITSLAGGPVFAEQKSDPDGARVHGGRQSKSKSPHQAMEASFHRDSAAGSGAVQSKNGEGASKAAPAPGREILFFMNPNGRPCQMQLSIINGMKDKLASLASIKYIRTTEDADQEMFGKYGIRGLPSLIIVDTSGKELKRFTPGIQNEETILGALREPERK
jgi:thioredoxin 1